MRLNHKNKNVKQKDDDNKKKYINDFKNVTKDYTSYSKKPDLGDLAKKYDEEGNNYDFKKTDSGMYEIDNTKAPYSINQEEFINSNEDYDKYTLEYWEEDDTFSDENDEVIRDVDFQIGDIPEDVNTKYIRNDAKKEDYEVVRI